MTIKDANDKFKKIIPGFVSGRIFLNHETGIISTEFQGRQYCLDMNTLQEVDPNCVAIAEYEGIVKDAKEQMDWFCKTPVIFTEEQKQQIRNYREQIKTPLTADFVIKEEKNESISLEEVLKIIKPRLRED